MPEPSAAQLTAADLRPTGDGSLTLYSHRYRQTYGSAHGAQAQARHVFVGGTGIAASAAGRVLEIGFGVGQNLRATLAAREGQRLDYLAYEVDPVPVSVLAELAPAAAASPLWQALLAAWPPAEGEELRAEAGPQALRVVRGNVLHMNLPRDWADAVYLDGFSPDDNPELWSEAFLARVAGALRPGGVLATYSAAGRVRRALVSVGLAVEKRPGPPGKREFLRAVRP